EEEVWPASIECATTIAARSTIGATVATRARSRGATGHARSAARTARIEPGGGMRGKQMEGGNRQRRQKAREARERGHRPSEEAVTTGASKQRTHLIDKEHDERIET